MKDNLEYFFVLDICLVLSGIGLGIFMVERNMLLILGAIAVVIVLLVNKYIVYEDKVLKISFD